MKVSYKSGILVVDSKKVAMMTCLHCADGTKEWQMRPMNTWQLIGRPRATETSALQDGILWVEVAATDAAIQERA